MSSNNVLAEGISADHGIRQTATVRGVVTDEAGNSLPGATVIVKGTNNATTTNANGVFTLTNVPATAVLEVSFLGFVPQEIPVNARLTIEIAMVEEAAQIEGVVILGSFERERSSFTGAISTVSGSSLRSIGVQNVVESFKSLDPSFAVLENIAEGANPNVLPTIEVRGQTSINITDVDDVFRNDPNQPLFILDGFETTLQKIIDLDFNRVASVSLLKDAASTAFYGSRAANGILVVETIKAETGRYRFTYSSDYSLQLPNLSSYNMMNAEEKLEFERLSGRYMFDGGNRNPSNTSEARIQADLDMLYSRRLAEIRRGVESYWMGDPLNVPLIHRQSLRMSGGSGNTTVNIGASYRDAPGIMKGSKRESWSGDFDFTFNNGKFYIINRMGLSGYNSSETPYGSFSDWVRMNPYYRKTNEYGDYEAYVDEVRDTYNDRVTYRVANPHYNASLLRYNDTRSIDIDERLEARWNFYKGMRIQGMVQLNTGTVNTQRFTPPEDTRYEGVDLDRVGNYYSMSRRNLSYRGNLMYVWNNRIGDHNYVFNARGEIGHQDTSNESWQATGFPIGTNGRPSFANNFIDGRPTYSSRIHRFANFLFSANYSFKNKYLFDATYRMDGTTVFGAAKKFRPFWSTGIGWNLHEEEFLKSSAWIQNLRLRATFGQTGNQNLDHVISSSIYSYMSGGNLFGPGLQISQMGNPYVEWQKTTTTNLAIDFNILSNRISGTVDVYQKHTNPMAVSVDQAPSTGISRLPMSLGHLTYQGVEFNLNADLIRSTVHQFNWRIRIMGAMIEGKYGGFEQRIEGLNQSQQESNTLTRFRDEYSPKTQWAVRSLGIDPATGRELFLDRYDKLTFLYNPADIVAVGSSEPDIMGTISTNIRWKKFTLSGVMRYSIGADVFNRALFDKVENISFNEIAYNQDRRALHDRWQQPGDVAQFKSIRFTSHTPMSSRFIQKENFLSGESITLQYRLDRSTWIQQIKLDNLEFSANAAGTGGVFRISNVKRERGTSFPEAYTVSFSIRATF